MFGLLGPNGAGKTTTVEVLEGYRAARRRRRCRVLGHDPGERVGRAARAGGDRAAELRHLPAPDRARDGRRTGRRSIPRRATSSEVLALAGLEEAADRRARTLSGGQQRRLDFALALVGDPELIFLDEPTTGFDPAARRAAWDVVRALRDLGKTVRADHALPGRGAGAGRPRGDPPGRPDPGRGPAGRARRRRATASPGARPTGRREERFTEDPTALLHELTAAALARGERLEDLSVTRPSLEDVYLELTEA